MAAQFSIKGLSANSNSLLGVWQADPDDLGAAAFGMGEAAAEVVWSVSLPHDVVLAQDALQEQKDLLQDNRAALAEARQILQQLPPDLLDNSAGVAFSVGEGNQAEANLQNHLAYLTGQSEGAVAFGLETPAENEEWLQTVAGYQAFMEQLFQLLSPTLLAETRIEEKLQAVTMVSLTGNINTTWHGEASLAHRHLHQETLSLSLESRIAMLQLVGQISTGAAALAVKFNIPGGQLMALPAAWAYLQDVMAQSQTTLAKTQQAVRLRT